MLAFSPAHLLFLIGISAALAGCRGATSAEPTPTPARAAEITFTDVTAPAGFGSLRHMTGARGDEWFPETVGAAVAVVDFDGDAWPDLLWTAGGTWDDAPDAPPAVRLFRNAGDGTFTDVTAEAGLAELRAYPMGLAVADVDADGDDDVFVSTLAENLLLRNDGGRFTEVGAAAGVADHAAWSTSALFFDADVDGDVDLYVGNYVEWSPDADIWCTMDGRTKAYCTPQVYEGTPGRFYLNDGGGTFTESTAAAGFDGAPGKTLGVAETDVDHDGLPDLVVANDTQRDLLYLNRGDGTFEEQGIRSGIAFAEDGRARAGMGIDVGDVDGDGEPTIFVGHFTNEMVGVYRHVGEALFVDRAASSLVGRPSLPTLTFGLFLFDPDLDGDLDLFLANGHIAEEVEQTQEGIGYRQRSQLFLNTGAGRFEESRPSGGAFERSMVARGAAYLDFDRDGDLDVAVAENGGGLYLWRNDTGGRSVRVRLEGTTANRSALGAEIVALVDGRRQVRRVRSGSSFLSQSERVATFGLGAAAQVDSLVVRWPGGGTDRFAPVPAGAYRLLQGGALVPEGPPS